MKRILATLLCLALVLGFVPFMSAPQSSAAETVPEGYIAISTPEDLFLIRNNMAGNYMLTNDIDLTEALAEGGSLYNKTEGWVAIGYTAGEQVEFAGILDGNGYKIYGLQCSGVGAALVWYNSGTIQNLTIASGEIKANNSGAGFALTNIGTIYNCQNYANITLDQETGGKYSKICAGGIAATTTADSVISLCGNGGTISVRGRYNAYVGGIAGEGRGLFSSAWNSGDITVKVQAITGVAGNYGAVGGGIIGVAPSELECNDAYNAGEIYAIYDGTSSYTNGYAGGILGYGASSVSSISISQCYNAGKISGLRINGSHGITLRGTKTNCYCINTSLADAGATTLSDTLMQMQASFAGFDFENIWVMGPCSYKYPIFKAALASAHTIEHVEEKEETCTENGTYEHWYCSVCEKYFANAEASEERTIDELTISASHKYTEIITEPNCVEQGFTTHTCARCQDSYVDTYVSALEHDIIIDTAVDATCTQTGLTEGSHCTRCDDATVAQEIIDALGHDIVIDVAVDASCTENGLTAGSHCTRCEEATVEQSVVEAYGHSYTSETTAPNCTEQGCTTYTCTACGDTYSDSYVDALGHNWDNGAQTIAPTCTEEGVMHYSCLTCGETKDDTIAANGHSYDDTIIAPNCTEDGYTTHTCSVCGDSYIDTAIDALGHSWDEGTVIIAATCTANGKMKYTCTACGETKEETIIATGHSYVDTVTRPTCTEVGYTTHLCSNCGDSYKDTYVGATGHAWNDGIDTVKPTCTEVGEKVFTCGNCGETRSEEIAALGHSYEAVVTAPTCTEGGYATYNCSTCGDSYVADKVSALGHSYEAVVTAPTCTEGGYTTYTCSTCGDSYVADEVAATGHSYEDGNCSVCGEEDPDYLPENPFVDVKEKDYFYMPVLWAVQRGITTGTSSTTFSPNDPCTRGQIVTFLWRSCGSPEPTKTNNPFSDVKANEYYYKAVLWAVENGITTGLSATKFGPNETCTRGQVATFLWRSQGKPAPISNNNPFKDVKSSDYYYEAVLWAVENNVTQGTGVGKFSPNDSCTRGQIVTFLYRALEK